MKEHCIGWIYWMNSHLSLGESVFWVTKREILFMNTLNKLKAIAKCSKEWLNNGLLRYSSSKNLNYPMIYSHSSHPRCIWQSKTKHRSWIKNTKQGFVKKNVRGFRYKPRGDWFSFAVNKTWFLWDEYILTGPYSTLMSYAIRWNAPLSWTCVWQLAEARDYGL